MLREISARLGGQDRDRGNFRVTGEIQVGQTVKGSIQVVGELGGRVREMTAQATRLLTDPKYRRAHLLDRIDQAAAEGQITSRQRVIYWWLACNPNSSLFDDLVTLFELRRT